MPPLDDYQLERAKTKNRQQKEILQSRLDAGILSQQEYEDEIIRIDKDLEKEQAKIELRSAIRDRAIKSFSVITDTAQAIMKTIAASPLTGGLPWSAVVAAIGAAQLATIATAPLPKAARGGLISGPTHAAGGVPIEAEGGETIINRRSSKAYLELLSLINQAGGGVPFVAPLSDGAYAVSHAYDRSGLTGAQLTQAVRNGLQDLKIYTTIEDIRRQDAIYTRMENRGNGF